MYKFSANQSESGKKNLWTSEKSRSVYAKVTLGYKWKIKETQTWKKEINSNASINKQVLDKQVSEKQSLINKPIVGEP